MAFSLQSLKDFVYNPYSLLGVGAALGRVHCSHSALTKSGTRTCGLGLGRQDVGLLDSGTWDSGTRGRGTGGRGDVGLRDVGCGDVGPGDAETLLNYIVMRDSL